MSNIIPSLKYAWLTIQHKYFVFRAGLWTKAPIWRLITHDLSKFGPKELPHYGRQFYGDKSEPEKFRLAWQHHWHHNPHHWEYWIIQTQHNRVGKITEQSLDMDESYVREMIADWFGASRAYDKRWPASEEDWPWLRDNYHRLKLSRNTKLLVEKILKEAFQRKNLK